MKKIVIESISGKSIKAEMIENIECLAKEDELTMDGYPFDPARMFEEDCEKVISVTSSIGYVATDSSVAVDIYTVTTSEHYYYFAKILDLDGKITKVKTEIYPSNLMIWLYTDDDYMFIHNYVLDYSDVDLYDGVNDYIEASIEALADELSYFDFSDEAWGQLKNDLSFAIRNTHKW